VPSDFPTNCERVIAPRNFVPVRPGRGAAFTWFAAPMTLPVASARSEGV
jgi:hypothetical protein